MGGSLASSSPLVWKEVQRKGPAFCSGPGGVQISTSCLVAMQCPTSSEEGMQPRVPPPHPIHTDGCQLPLSPPFRGLCQAARRPLSSESFPCLPLRMGGGG